MSQENVEIVRLGWGAWSRGDMDRLFAFLAEDVVYDTSHLRDWPEGEYIGHAGFRRFLTEWLEVWDAFEVGVDEFVAVSDGRVVALFWQRGVGRHSGLAMDAEWAQIHTIRDGKAARIEVYDSRSDALEAVGLSEQDARADS
jgi:ketosteroid isomerase-like protein